MSCFRQGLRAAMLMLAAWVCAPVSAQTPLVRTHAYKLPGVNGSPGSTVRFPLISMPDARVSERINIFLHHFLLGTLPPPADAPAPPARPGAPLAPTNAVTGMAELEVEAPVSLYQGRVLAVAARAEGCGAYCESYERYFAFDARSGRLLLPAELFTPAGLKAVSARTASLNTATLKKAVREARQALRGKKLSADDKERYGFQVDLYEECVERYKPGGYMNNGKYQGAMRLVAGGIEWTDGRCSNHATRAMDDVYDLKSLLSFDTLAPWLSPYGRAILLGEGDAAPPALNGRAQIFKGALQGPLPIVLIFGGSEYSSLDLIAPFGAATYYYQRIRKPIELKVEREGEAFTLTEEGNPSDKPDVAPTGVIKVKLVGRKLIGQWRGGGKELAFEAEAF